MPMMTYSRPITSSVRGARRSRRLFRGYALTHQVNYNATARGQSGRGTPCGAAPRLQLVARVGECDEQQEREDCYDGKEDVGDSGSAPFKSATRFKPHL